MHTATIDMRWNFPDGAPWGTSCVSGGGLCVTMAHLLFEATPADPLVVLVPSADVSYDGGATWAPGASATFENHVVPPSNNSQVFTWNLARLSVGGAPPPPSSGICVRPWVVAPPAVAGGAWARGELAPFCVNGTSLSAITTVPPNVAIGATDPPIASLLFGNFSRQCSSAANRCRLLGHIAFDVAVRNVITPVDAAGEVSLDGGATWRPAGHVVSLAKLDASTSSTTSQRFHWGLDLPLPYDAKLPRVCYRIGAVDELGLGAAMVKMDVTATSHPSGIALDNVTRCWDF